MVYLGRVKNGQIVLDTAARLPEGAEVRVDVVVGPTIANGEEAPTLRESLKPIIGIINDLPEDASRNVDHYLYGYPKNP